MTGLCYHTTFADWRCTFGGGVEAAPATQHVCTTAVMPARPQRAPAAAARHTAPLVLRAPMIRPSRLHISTPGVALGLALAVAAPAARAQPGSGAPYGARDAHHCTVPTPRGALGIAEAAQAFVCTAEHDDGDGLLYLVEDVRVQVGRGRPFQYRSDAFPDVDPTALVYPIRGSFVQYQCSTRRHEQAMGNDPNTNCTARPAPSASGVCFTTTFGDLRCTLLDVNAPSGRRNAAPPQ